MRLRRLLLCMLSLCRSTVELAKLIRSDSRNYSMDQAAADPDSLSQETIIENIDPKEWARLSRVRNIGIAVCWAR